MADTTENRKVSPKEVEKLYTFTREHYVEYYDLQTELVDHLANGIEKRWQNHPDLAFEENLHREFKKFGVFGFSDVVKNREKAMTKRYWKLIWQEILQQIRHLPIALPLTALTAGLVYFRTVFLFDIILVLAFGQSLFFLFKTFRLRKKTRAKKRVYLLEKLIVQGSGVHSGTLYLSIMLNPGIGFTLSPQRAPLLYACFWALLIALVLLVNYVSLYILPQKKEEILVNIYPERKFHKP